MHIVINHKFYQCIVFIHLCPFLFMSGQCLLPLSFHPLLWLFFCLYVKPDSCHHQGHHKCYQFDYCQPKLMVILGSRPYRCYSSLFLCFGRLFLFILLPVQQRLDPLSNSSTNTAEGFTFDTCSSAKPPPAVTFSA